jgi:hypothetical protein
VPDEDRPAYLLGRAAHALILEGLEVFGNQFAVGGPVNPTTGKPYGLYTKAYADWAAAQRKPVITDEQYDLIHNLRRAVRAHAVAVELLASGTAEGVVRTEYCGTACQIRMDWFDPQAGIVDLKTCDDLTWFEADARRYGYLHQLAFYRAVMNVAAGKTFPVNLIAVEKKEPFRCGVWLLDAGALDYAQKENEAAIERLKACQAANSWPTGYEERRVFDSI